MPRRKRAEGTRAPNGASSIYQRRDGKWHGRVTMGIRGDGNVRRPGQAWTVEKWLTHWVENIAAPSVKYKALAGYRTAVYRHLIPNLGAHRIDRIEPEHFEKLYARMIASGLQPGTAHHAHRTARLAFGEAFKRSHIVRNPVALAKPPRVEDMEIEPFDAADIQRLIRVALRRRNGVRFVLALALGTRQGETIGLKWSRLDEPNKPFVSSSSCSGRPSSTGVPTRTPAERSTTR
jgi:integrase